MDFNSYMTGQRARHRLNHAQLGELGFGILLPELFDFLEGVSTLNHPFDHRLYFQDRFSEAAVENINALTVSSPLFVLSREFAGLVKKPHIISDHPRHLYSAIIGSLFKYDKDYFFHDRLIAADAKIHANARISAGVAIGRGCEVGEDTIIMPNVVIGPNCRIGARCHIRSGAVIGQPGYGIYVDGAGIPRHLPHVGGVLVEDDVEIGALTTIVSGTIHPTVIGKDAKVDDHVHIAHNCIISPRALVVACAEVSGSVTVGEDAWIGPNVAVREGLVIGRGAFVGIGAVVLRDVVENTRVVGNPARLLPSEK